MFYKENSDEGDIELKGQTDNNIDRSTQASTHTLQAQKNTIPRLRWERAFVVMMIV